MEADEIAFEGGWTLVYPDCSIVALDSGYPYRAFHLSQVKVWNSRTDAEKYQKMFSKERFELRQVFLGLMRVKA